ncbi:MAG: 3-phosphoshikimate 1-carboxyvinyltransferase [Archaeoglobi archaeon]|nr:3-phosphoshikimate 1-carboxyvinyltransferase [Archaeoglobi archaeon]MDK2780982.1 3-phosphoshikimate 1-carboxyvinyltransferase [Archaeoglobi archaeon]
MRAIIKKSKLSGEVLAPPSKSYTHRAVVLASLSRESEIENPLIARDTRATIRACEKIGAEIEFDEERNVLKVRGVESSPSLPDDVINAENSGTTLRFFTGICSTIPGISVLTGDDSLRKRPNTPLINALNELGAKVISTKGDGTAPLIVEGKLKGGSTSISGEVSSQFLSSLLISTPLAEESSEIEVTSRIASRPYVDMTLEMLSLAKVKVEERENRFIIPGAQSFEFPESFRVPGDFSSASFIICGAAITQSSVRVGNLEPSRQGDSAIIDILLDMGGNIEWDVEERIVRVYPSELQGIEIDASDIPDLVPVLAVVGTCAEGETVLHNVGRLRYKESDRLEAISSELRKMGAEIEVEGNTLIVRESKLYGAHVYGHRDHRIVMALAVAGLVAEGETVIEGAEVVDVSYPNFFYDLYDIGARLKLE